MVKYFFSAVCLATSIDRTSAAFSVRWHRASLTFTTHYHFLRLSCHPAGSVEMRKAQKAGDGPLAIGEHWGEKYRAFFSNICLKNTIFKNTCKNTFQCSNLVIWFPGNKMNKQKPLVLIPSSNFVISNNVWTDAEEKGIYLTIIKCFWFWKKTPKNWIIAYIPSLFLY